MAHVKQNITWDFAASASTKQSAQHVRNNY